MVIYALMLPGGSQGKHDRFSGLPATPALRRCHVLRQPLTVEDSCRQYFLGAHAELGPLLREGGGAVENFILLELPAVLQGQPRVKWSAISVTCPHV